MPTFRGIKLSIVSQWGLQIHPEFPHPDSTQVTDPSPHRQSSVAPTESVPSKIPQETSKYDSSRGEDDSFRVSCYIPSIAGARFWLRYSLVEAAAINSTWYFFRLYINGRHITSWGTNAKTKPTGQVMRALFNPSERWNYQHDGVVYKNNGTEARHFFFNHEPPNVSAAIDGGMIEVQVFRAFGRTRKLPKPLKHMPQEQYGIVMPTAGLIDNPQDAKFYDYHLQDARDQPFAIFDFHYRGWKTLISQHLVPEDYPQSLLVSSKSIMALNRNPKYLHGEFLHPRDPQDHGNSPLRVDEIEMYRQSVRELEAGCSSSLSIEALNIENLSSSASTVEAEASGVDWSDSMSSEGSVTPWLMTVFDDFPEPPRSSISGAYNNKSSIPVSRFSKGSSRPLPIPDTTHNTKRPLPTIPLVQKPHFLDLEYTRAPSTTYGVHDAEPAACLKTPSKAPSLTPSLLEHIDRNAMSPEPIIGVAQVQRLSSGNSTSKHGTRKFFQKADADNEIPDSKIPAESSSSEPSLVPPRTKRRGMTSPPLGGLFTMTNITFRKHKSSLESVPNLLTSAGHLASPKSTPTNLNDDEGMEGDTTSISLTESEWMCRTPSPVKDAPEYVRASKLWSPGIEQKRSSKEGGLRHRARKWYDNVRSSSSENSPSTKVNNRGVRVRSGNWI